MILTFLFPPHLSPWPTIKHIIPLNFHAPTQHRPHCCGTIVDWWDPHVQGTPLIISRLSFDINDKGGTSKWNLIVVVSTAVPSSFVGVDSFDKTRSILSLQTASILQQIIFPHQRVNLRREGGNCDIEAGVRQSEIGSWSCQLWYLHPSWVLTLLTKRDLYFYCRQPPFFSRSSFHINVWIYAGRGGCDFQADNGGCVKVKLDRCRVNCGTFILRGCWLLGSLIPIHILLSILIL